MTLLLPNRDWAMTVRASCDAPFYRSTVCVQTVVCKGGQDSGPNLERRRPCREERAVGRHRPVRQAAVSRASGIVLAICGTISRRSGPKSERRTASCVAFARAWTHGIVHHARTLPRPDHVRKPAWWTDWPARRGWVEERLPALGDVQKQMRQLAPFKRLI